MNSNFEASPAHQSTGNEYSWDGKGPGFESDQDLFFFSKAKHSVSKKFWIIM